MAVSKVQNNHSTSSSVTLSNLGGGSCLVGVGASYLLNSVPSYPTFSDNLGRTYNTPSALRGGWSGEDYYGNVWYGVWQGFYVLNTTAGACTITNSSSTSFYVSATEFSGVSAAIDGSPGSGSLPSLTIGDLIYIVAAAQTVVNPPNEPSFPTGPTFNDISNGGLVVSPGNPYVTYWKIWEAWGVKGVGSQSGGGSWYYNSVLPAGITVDPMGMSGIMF